MARHTKEYNEGYQAAIEAIKKQLENGGGSQSNSGGGQELPSDMTTPQEATGGKGGQQDKSQNQSNSGSSGNSRTNPNDASQGVVRPEDCCSNNSGVENTPGTPGGFFDKSEGDKLAQSEGYNKDGGSESTVEQDWKDAAVRAANKINSEPGSAMGRLKTAIEGLHKVTTDWKNALRKIVGRSINPEDKRQAYANKNILVSQDRIARTDKDKYDNMDYMIALIDSSGSINTEQLRMMLSEVYSIALAKKPIKLIVMQCDTKIQEIKEYTNLKDLKDNLTRATVKGGGGTDFADLWKLLETDKKFRGKKPDLIMLFTDGYVNQLPRNKRTMNHLIWCIIDNPSFNVKYNDSLTKVIHINSADIK